MNLLSPLRTWWQRQTGEEETPFDGDTPVWLVSLVFHLCLIVALSLITLTPSDHLTIIIDPVDEKEDEDILELVEDFVFDDVQQQEIGALSKRDVSEAMSLAPLVADISNIPLDPDIPITEHGEILEDPTKVIPTGREFSENHLVAGGAGVGTSGAAGAIDRLTHEILMSLEERKTLVVWMFDQSGSLNRQRAEIHDRFDRIYEELGLIEASGNPAFAKYEDKPLVSSVVSFGNNVNLVTKKPTDNLAEIKEAIASIKQDDTGTERVFSATYLAAQEYASYRQVDAETGEPIRNVMIIIFTDEKGDDQEGLEKTIDITTRNEMPVYVVGVPAPFGRQETLVKWVDPDPEFDQTPQWGEVNQGPESFLPERIKIAFGNEAYERPIDSGFGPYSLTRLCYETGGIYFTVHPNRNVNRTVSQRETADYSAHLSQFFDPEVMRKYRPDYVPVGEYQRRVASLKSRQALVEAATRSVLMPMEKPRLKFVKRSEADFASDLSEAQQQAAKLEPKVLGLYSILKMGESDRAKEDSLRWQAGYDLAMGRAMAVKARTEGYNAMLAAAKRGLEPKDPKNNTWELVPANELAVGSKLEDEAEKAREYLQRVVDEHPGTPWAFLAEQELSNPIGWVWKDSFTDFTPRQPGMGNGNAPPPSDDKRNMLKKGPPKRKVPKL
jgi:hypothetical protein